MSRFGGRATCDVSGRGLRELRRSSSEVESLLAAYEQAGDFTAHPILRESFVGDISTLKIVADVGEGG